MRHILAAGPFLLFCSVVSESFNFHRHARTHRGIADAVAPRATSPKCPARPHPPNQPANLLDGPTGGCFPSLDFQMPLTLPNISSLETGWWCDSSAEYAFMGFSYSVASCACLSFLVFNIIRNLIPFLCRPVKVSAATRVFRYPPAFQRPLCPSVRRL